MRPRVEILPLYARLSVAEQQRVFAPSRGRRIVLATNVAETSLTVPGIRYVIDSGLARVKRYSLRNKTTLLQIEKISQAAANQRAGRCGRVAAGICVRLYGEDDFAARPPYTDPEILRSSLAAVILRMAALGLSAVDAFPFLEAPSPRAIADGYQLLQELSAVDAQRALTPLGRELARLPVDPRVGRMVLAAREAGCLAEVLVIASALSVPDPRDRPLAKQQAADQAHLIFRDERSDFLSLLALWEFFGARSAEKLSHRRLVDAVPRAFRVVPAAARMARRARAARGRDRGAGLEVEPSAAGDDRRGALSDDPPSAARRAPRQHRLPRTPTATSDYLGARGTPLPSASRARARQERRRNGCSRPSWSRPRASTRAARRRSSRMDRGGRRRPGRRATISSRAGTRIAARSSRASACSSTA